MGEYWTMADDLPSERVDRRGYLEVMADTFGLTADDVAEMEAERAAYEAAHPRLDADAIPATDSWGLASEWASVEGGCVQCGSPHFDEAVGLCGECLGVEAA